MRKVSGTVVPSRSARKASALAAGLLWAAGLGGQPAPHADVTIVAGDFFFRAPRTVVGGRTTIRLRNLGPRFHHAVLLQLGPGEARELAVARAKAWVGDPDRPIPGTVSVGGPEGRMPSGDSFITVELAPGEYLIVCTIPLSDGAPHASRGMYAPLTVTARRVASPQRASTPDLVIRMTEYAYTPSAERLRSGWRTIRVENAGRAEHIAEVAVLKPGRNATDLLRWAEGGFRAEDEPMTTVGGTTRLAPGRRSDVRLQLEKGRYVIFCMLHGPGGRQHLRLGMIRELTVE
jgi:uncharacterized cupredoxin-like copper-binding protein